MPASLTGFMLSLSTFNNCYFFTLTLLTEFDFLKIFLYFSLFLTINSNNRNG